MPRQRDIFDALHGCKVFSKIDFQSAYLQIPVPGQYEFNFVPFGLNIASNKLQRELNTLSCGVPDLLGYAEDWLVTSVDWLSHVATLCHVFSLIASAGFLIKPAKCVFAAPSTTFLGRVISVTGIALSPEDKDTIASWPVPRDPKSLQRI
jgi:uncharacterized protein involved in cysteine biosynthesis